MSAGELTLLDKTPRIFWGLDWSPDGNAIAFLNDAGAIGIIDLHTQQIDFPYQNGQIDRTAGFSWKDENTVLFVLQATGEAYKEILQLSVKDASWRSIYQGRIQRFAYDRATGMLWVYTGLGYVLPSDGRTIKTIYDGPDEQFQWSPEGTALIGKKELSQIVLLDAENGYEMTPLETMGTLGKNSWSPDGQQVAILSEAANGQQRLSIVARDGLTQARSVLIPIS